MKKRRYVAFLLRSLLRYSKRATQTIILKYQPKKENMYSCLPLKCLIWVYFWGNRCPCQPRVFSTWNMRVVRGPFFSCFNWKLPYEHNWIKESPAWPGMAGPAQPNKPRLPAGSENAEAYVALAFSTLSIGCTLEKLCQDLGDIQWEIVSPTPSNSGMYEYSILY